MTELLTRELGGELEVRSESDRIVDARLLRWGEVASTPQGRERFVRGAFRGIDPASVSLEAIGPHGAQPGVRLAGRGIELEDRDDGPHASFRVSRTRDGDELLELARDGVYRTVSVVFEPVEGGSRMGRDGVIERIRANLVRVGIVERGAYGGAAVLAVRGADTMPTETEPNPNPEPEPTPPPTPTPGVTVLARTAENADALDALRSEMLDRMTRLEATGRSASGPGGPLARFVTFADYLDASYGDPVLARALADQLTTDSPGIVPPSWVQTIAGIGTFTRPAVTALGGARSLGDSGMELDWPFLDPALDLDSIVGVQAAEKTDIVSVKVRILKGSSPIATYAGGSDVSYQLIRRSSPSYREAYVRILTLAYNRATEAAFEAALEAGAGATAVLGAGADANALRAFLFEASAKVNAATGAPATVDLVSSDEFIRIGGDQNLAPPQYGTSNISGIASASTLRIEVSGLPIVEAPFLPAATHIVTNGEAAGWHEDGPFPISAEDVAKLGQNVAVWGMGTSAIVIPAGIVTNVLVTAAASSSKSSSKS
jgi:Escherichia/Staphylococcus phage prohead protease